MTDKQILICGSHSSFPDDLRGVCECGRAITFRPHMAHIAHKVCLGCGMRMLKQDKAARIGITKKVMQEVAENFNAKLN